jgi:uncharacterized protein YoxC
MMESNDNNTRDLSIIKKQMILFAVIIVLVAVTMNALVIYITTTLQQQEAIESETDREIREKRDTQFQNLLNNQERLDGKLNTLLNVSQ